MKRHAVTRRDLLQAGGIAVIGAGGLTLAGIGGYAWPHDNAAAASIPTVPPTPNDARGVLTASTTCPSPIPTSRSPATVRLAAS